MIFTIETLLEDATWRLRAYLGSPAMDPEHVGWRCDSELCPAAQWLNEELIAISTEIYDDMLFIGEQLYAMPPLLANFIRIVDAKTFADPALRHPLDLVGDRVSQQEALAALALAQGLAGQLCAEPILLPGPLCVYPGCHAPAATGRLYGFLDIVGANAFPVRENCLEFVGSLCDTHVPCLVFPPNSWWSLGKVTTSTSEAVLV